MNKMNKKELLFNIHKHIEDCIQKILSEYLKFNNELEEETKENDLLLDKYYISSINKIKSIMKILYKNKEIFEYVLEKYYSYSLNPFTTAYHEFMNWFYSGIEIELIFNRISEGIFRRLLYEKTEHSIYTIFK